MAKRILIDENAAQAESCIKAIESIYLERVSHLAARIRELGVIDVDKELLLETIKRNFSPLKELYQELYNKDIKGLASEVLKQQVAASFEAKLQKINYAVGRFYETVVREQLPFDLDVLAGVFEMENGRVFIPAEKKAVIMESFKRWIEKPEYLQVYNLHQETAKKIQSLWDALEKANMVTHAVAPGFTLLNLFEIKDGANGVTFEPKRLNFEQ